MPEGPSIVILKELMLPYKGKKIRRVTGNAKIDLASLAGKKIIDLRSWGKQFFIVLPHTTIRIHFLLFGTYSLDEQTKPDKSLRLGLYFTRGSVFFYTCSVKMITGDLEKEYDWEADVMSDQWNPRKARKKLKEMPSTMVCDALLDQHLFAGVGNIIKNEVLYRIKLHPQTRIKNIPVKKLSLLIKEVRQYSFDFYKWKKAYELKKNWQVHTKKICPGCAGAITKKYFSKTKRRSFFCKNCQARYT